jgi:hypothetical protein
LSAALRSNLTICIDDRDTTLAWEALNVLADNVGLPAVDVLVRVAETGRLPEWRMRAYDALRRLKADEKVDKVAMLTLDLKQAKTCPERRDVVVRAKEAADPRLLPILKKERGRRGGFLGLQSANGCMQRELDEAIRALEGAGPGEAEQPTKPTKKPQRRW